jgi:hypothetical protein
MVNSLAFGGGGMRQLMADALRQVRQDIVIDPKHACHPMRAGETGDVECTGTEGRGHGLSVRQREEPPASLNLADSTTFMPGHPRHHVLAGPTLAGNLWEGSSALRSQYMDRGSRSGETQYGREGRSRG